MMMPCSTFLDRQKLTQKRKESLKKKSEQDLYSFWGFSRCSRQQHTDPQGSKNGEKIQCIICLFSSNGFVIKCKKSTILKKIQSASSGLDVPFTFRTMQCVTQCNFPTMALFRITKRYVLAVRSEYKGHISRARLVISAII